MRYIPTNQDHERELKLRAYEPPDFAALYQMDQVCYPPGIAYSKRELRWYLTQPNAESLVALVNGEIAGFIVGESKGSKGHLITLDVLPNFRRQRIGSALLVAIEDRLAAKGVREVELETATNNHAAVAFWQKHGYRTVAVRRGYYLGQIDAFVMIKSLGAKSTQTASASRES